MISQQLEQLEFPHMSSIWRFCLLLSGRKRKWSESPSYTCYFLKCLQFKIILCQSSIFWGDIFWFLSSCPVTSLSHALSRFPAFMGFNLNYLLVLNDFGFHVSAHIASVSESLPKLILLLLRNQAGPYGALPSTKAFLCLPFLACRKKVSASQTFPEFQRADSNSQ